MRRALLVAAGALLAAAIFFAGGSSDGPLAWIGGGAVVAAALAIGLVMVGRLPFPELDRAGLLFVGLLTAFVIWNGVTIAWSVAPDRSWNYFNRGLVYLAFALLGVALGAAFRRAPRLVAFGLAALIGAACFWALAGKVVPALYEDYGRFARLRSPVGYWNGLALLGAIGLPLGLWLASVREHARWLRASGVVLLYLLGISILLTYSRGGLLTAVFVVVAYLVLSRARVEGIGALVIAASCAFPALLWGLTQPGVADNFQPRDVRVEDGAWFGLIVFVGALAAFGLAWLAAPRRASARAERIVVRVAIGAAVVVALGVSVAVLRGGEDIVSQDPGRLARTGTNNRGGWWSEAVDVWRGQPLVGIGAGSFEHAHRRLRDKADDITSEPHNLVLQFAAETGLVGLAFFVGAVGAAGVGLWRLRGDPLTLALGLALPAYLLHGLLDYDWDFVAVTGPVLFTTGVLLASGRPERRLEIQPLWAVVSLLVAGAVLFSIAAPRLAASRVDEAYAALERAEFDAAVSKAQEARSLNPLSIEPLHAEAAAEEDRGRHGRAKELYVKAVEVQPFNWVAWYELGCFELEVLVDLEDARRDLGRAAQLDPRGPAGKALISGPAAQVPAQPGTGPC